MKTYLLDANILIALAWPVHVHYAKAREWFESSGRKSWSTCPVTQAAFVRISSNSSIIQDAVRPEHALEMMKAMTQLKGHRFWPADVSMTVDDFSLLVLTGHRQVTDAYLVALAKKHRGVVATMDKGMLVLGGKRYVELIA